MDGGSSNAQSTAYAVQGLVAAHSGGDLVGRALRYLQRLQRRDGSIRYSRISSQTPVWVTAQALTALRRKPFPLRPVPRKRRRHHAAAAATPAASTFSTSPKPPERHSARHQAAASDSRPHRLEPTDRGALGTQRSSGRASAKGGGGPPAWLVASAALAALAGVLGLRVLLRRRRVAPS
jgi:predicted nucleic acid-binding protein